MSSLYKFLKNQGLKQKDSARFAMKLMQAVGDTLKKKMKELYQKIKQPKQGKYIKRMLRIMIEIFGKVKAKNIAKANLEDLCRKRELARGQQTDAVAVTEAFESEMDALLQSVQIEQGALDSVPLSQQLGNVFIFTKEAKVVNNAKIIGNSVSDTINASVNVNMIEPSLPQSTSSSVPNNPMTYSSEDIQAEKDAIIRRIKNTWEHEGMNFSQRPTVDIDTFYTEINIMGSDFSQVNINHEIWQVETAHMAKASGGDVIKYHDLFKPGVGGRTFVKNVLTKGIAGIGKTTTVKKYFRDWAEGRYSLDTDFDFVFLFPFRDLNKYNQMQGDSSLHELVCFFYPELKKLDSATIFDRNILLIFDGLDECEFPLDRNNHTATDVKEKAPLDVILTSLMSGKLLSTARLWITTRPVAAAKLPEEILTQGYVSQIQGFNDQQKEEYFRKHIKDEKEAAAIMSHLKTSRSLDIMCHVPLFCWMAASVLTSCKGVMPQSLTEMYIHFLIVQTGFSYKKYNDNRDVQSRSECLEKHKEVILKLGELAFKNLETKQIYFTKKDLRVCGIVVSEALKCPGLCAELLKTESGLYEEKAYCFIHLSIQEFLAALYAYFQFASKNFNALEYFKPKDGKLGNLKDFLIAAVDKSLSSVSGHLDLFIRFLFGISHDSNKKLLEGFLPDHWSNSVCHKKVVQHIKALRRKNLSPDRCFNLVHCLIELHDDSYLNDLELHRKGHAKKPLSPFLCSVLAYQAVHSREELLELDLKKYRLTEECYLRFTPAIPFFKKVSLNCIGITKAFSPTLASALRVPNAQLTELDLSCNSLQSGMMFLSPGLCSPNCKIENLNLSQNRLNRVDVEVIRDVLIWPQSKLKILDLSNNDFEKSEVDVLCVGLRSSRLTILRLSGCCISSASSASLARVLASGKSNLKELDLSYNNPGDSVIECLLQIKNNPKCSLDTVNVDHAGDCREKPLLHKYYINLMPDLETANEYLHFNKATTKERIVKRQKEKQSYQDHLKRFDHCNQFMCTEGLTGRHYWEVMKFGSEAHVGVAYECISRKGAGDDVRLGQNRDSWNFFWSDKSAVSHDKIPVPVCASNFFKIGIFLDWPAGTLSFYGITGTTKKLENLQHLFTFHNTFVDPVYPAFRIQNPGTSLVLEYIVMEIGMKSQQELN